MNESKPDWYDLLKEESFQGKPFNMEKIRKAEQRVEKWTIDVDKQKRKNKWKIAAFSLITCISVLVFAVLFNKEGAQDEYVLIDLPLSHQEIANMLGATRESVSVVMSELAKEGSIKTGRMSVQIATALLPLA